MSQPIRGQCPHNKELKTSYPSGEMPHLLSPLERVIVYLLYTATSAVDLFIKRCGISGLGVLRQTLLHLFGQKRIALLVHVYPVGGKNALIRFVLIVLFQILAKRFPQVA